MSTLEKAPTPVFSQEEAANAVAMLELLQESMADLARDDRGWAKLDSFDVDGDALTRDSLLQVARRARVMSIADPLIRRAVNLHVAYIHGQGVTITAPQEQDGQQDLNGVVQAFLDDPSNLATFSSQQAREELERRLKTDGEAFHALPTNPGTGRVQVRLIPQREIVDVITDPEDAAMPWFYKRVYTTSVVEAGYAAGATRTRRETRTVYYPALGFRPAQRPKLVDSKPVEWGTPVVHTAVNRPDGSKWGTPDLMAALPWAIAYKGFLEDWWNIAHSLSRFAFRATAKSRPGAARMRDRIAAAPAADGSTVGQTAIMAEGQQLEAIGKSGATIDANSGRPLAAMVASAVDVPVTMLLSDPGVTGARATAETLDQPLQLTIRSRQSLTASLYKKVLDYVIDQAIKAPAGPLNGTVRIEPYTGRELVTLSGDQSRGITVDWPSIEKVPLETLVKAIVAADDTGKLPPLLIAKLLAVALDVDDVDDVLAKLVDDEGNFVDPNTTVGDAAATAAAEALRRGEDPARYV